MLTPTRAIVLSLAGWLLFGLAACAMFARVQAELLWGYWPLALYFGLWLGVVGLAVRKPESRHLRNVALSTASGFLLGFGFPGYLPVPFLLFFALIPLLLVQRQLAERDAGYRPLFWHALNTFFLYNFLATYWVTNTGLAAGLIAVVANSLLMTLPWLFLHWTARRAPAVTYLGGLAAWVSFEYLHHHWELNWPWLTLGNGFMQFPALVQWYEWTGVFAGTIWLLLVNWFTFRWLRRPFPRPLPVVPLLVILVPCAVSLVRYVTYAEPAGEEVTVVAVQPNFEPHFEKFSGRGEAQLDTFLRLSRAALAAGPADYLLYPETSFSRVDEDEPLTSPAVQALDRELRKLPVKNLITGISGLHFFRGGAAVSENVRYYPGYDPLEVLNAALQLNFPGGDFQTYRKGVFVPGAESFPFRKVLFFAEPVVSSLGGSTAGLGTQPERSAFVSEVATVAPVICYESVFGEYFTGYVTAGAQAAFVLTNDGWWDNTAGHRQHTWLSSLRAIETRRAVVRSANMGNCAFINQRGDVVAATEYGREGFLRGTIRLNDAVTFYVRYGDLFARICLLLTAMIFLTNIVKRFQGVRPTDEA